MDSRFVKLLTSNHPPSEDEMKEIDGFTAVPLAKLNQIEKTIEELEAQLALLHRNYEDISSSLQGYRTIMSPVRRLPDDILSEIFYHCLPTHRNPILSAAEAPVLLTRVSSRWRSVALSSPQIWTRLYISFCDDDRGSFPPYIVNGTPDIHRNEERRRTARRVLNCRVDAIKDWLARSGECPLSVSLTYSSTVYRAFGEPREIYPPDDATTRLFETILSHCSHLKSLDLMMPLEIYRQLDLMFSFDSFPILKEFMANFYHQVPLPEEPVDPETVKLFEAPCLERLSLTGYPASRLWALNTFPFADQGKRLTYFSSYVLLSPSEGFYLLQQCSNLIQCRLHIVPFVDGDALPIQGIAFVPKLRSLVLIDDNAHVRRDDKFYSSIDAPSLQWIDYSMQSFGPSVNGTTPEGPYPILHFLERFPMLRKLTLDPQGLAPDALRKVLQTVSPTLTHLHIGRENELRSPRQGGFYDAPSSWSLDLGILTVDADPKSTSEVLLPNLEIFELSSSSILDETLLQLITSRMDGASRDKCAALKRVRVFMKNSGKLDLKKEVAQHRERLEVEAGRRIDNFELDLELEIKPDLIMDPLSTSYGLQNNSMWQQHHFEEPVSDY